MYPYESSVVNLKEKLVLLNENEVKTTRQNSTQSPDTNSFVNNEKKALEWEKFLNKALVDDFLNEDLHLKLIKLFVKIAFTYSINI